VASDTDDREDAKSTKGKKGKRDKGEKGGKGRSNLVPAVVIAVGLVLGGKMMGGGSSGAETPAPGEHPAAAVDEHAPLDCEAKDLESAPKEGAVVQLPTQTLNLAGGNFLKVGVALQLSAAESKETFEEEGLAAKAANQVITVLGAHSAAELLDPAARVHVQEELTAAIRPLYECNVLEVLFTEFVIP